ncbi:hypothetical protein EYB25_007241 [Talaromyces marneffei]|uniref:uncharacterized protein n=1 Tax=Talaromyces marneffei TaxID=37727 RepID=UPI0012A966E1|nr:uncharacterized protein EYB26_008378 [Talaromyces marneffei]KAE8551009.1 hypothetical protein EYB25_007241 [Talaromyces marneffei]QGA20672.1 hypothetical protein EYB26_008378 [Talaromyces marneffei]
MCPLGVYDLPPHKVPATDTTSLHRTIAHAIKTGELQIIDDIAIDNGIDYTVYSVHITPIQDQGKLLYVVLSVHDVTKESVARQSNKELAYMNETYRVLVDTVKEYAIFMLDTTGCVATWNSGAAMIKGYSSDDIIGRHFSTFYGDLLVEDNIMIQTIMLKMLNIIGFEKVDTAWNGAEAVRKVKQKPLSYNAILMDINMPVMDGVDATIAIRRMSQDVPIIAMTGNALKGDSDAYLASGMNDYIAKPVHRQHLVSVLLKWIGP